MRKYNIGIIGSGQIVSGYDFPDDENIFTHCHALLNHPRLNLVGVYDIETKKLQDASIKWGFNPVYSIEELFLHKLDIVLIAVPDEFHASYLMMVAKYCPLMVICEKPLTTSLEESKKIVTLYKENGIQLFVNYQRRFDKDINNLKCSFENGNLGLFLTGSVVYSKGLLHNGSHAIDLLRYIFGNVVKSEKFSTCYDFISTDPSISGRLEFSFGEVFLLIGNENFYSTFEIDLLFEKARYKFTNSGLDIEIYLVENDPVFENYKALILKEKRSSTLNKALRLMWDEVANSLSNNIEMRNSAEEALQSQILCDELINK